MGRGVKNTTNEFGRSVYEHCMQLTVTDFATSSTCAVAQQASRYVYTHTRTRTRTHTHTHARAHTYTHAHALTHTHSSIIYITVGLHALNAFVTAHYTRPGDVRSQKRVIIKSSTLVHDAPIDILSRARSDGQAETSFDVAFLKRDTYLLTLT